MKKIKPSFPRKRESRKFSSLVPLDPRFRGDDIWRTKKWMLAFASIAVWLSLSFSAQASDHAIAMHGQPLYPASFAHYDYVNPDAPKGGNVRRAEVGTFDNLNPFLITGRVTSGLQEALVLTYDSLMTRAWNEPFTLYGLVAEKVTVPPDRSSITFHINPKAIFHDGKPVTTEDVKFSFEVLKKHGRPNQRRIYKLVKNIAIKDKHTIRLDLGEGHDRETVMILAMMPVIPKHYWADRDFGKTTLEPPLGGGPYKIADVKPGQRVIFERVENYWAADLPVARGLYNFDRLQYDFFRDDKAALQALAAGQADLRREWSAVAWKRDYNFAAVRSGNIIKEDFKNGRPARARFFAYNMRRPMFQDIRVRKALAYAFDFEWLNKSIFLDTQTRVDSIFMNSELAAPQKPKLPKTDGSGLAGLRANLRVADDLLGKAGYTVKDGLRMTPDGKPLVFEILLNDPADEKVALEYARALDRLGIKVAVRTVDTAQYIGRMSQFDFDMTLAMWRNSLSPGTEQAVYWGSAAADQQGSFNYSGLKSKKIDALIARLTGAETREGLVRAAQELDRAVMAAWIGVPLFDAVGDRVAYRKGIARPETTPLYGPSLESWWREAASSGKEDGKNLAPR